MRYSRCGLTLILSCCLVASCASRIPPASPDKLALRPIVRYVTWHGFREPWRDLYRQVSHGQVVFDGRFLRDPLSPPHALIEDCENVSGIGIMFELETPRRRRLKSEDIALPLRFRWTHSSIEIRDSGHDVYKSPILGTTVYMDGIRIDGREKANGIYEVSVTRMGEEIFRTGFELRGCDHGRPPWADAPAQAAE